MSNTLQLPSLLKTSFGEFFSRKFTTESSPPTGYDYYKEVRKYTLNKKRATQKLCVYTRELLESVAFEKLI